jgi:small subunit ribosomal protein S6e
MSSEKKGIKINISGGKEGAGKGKTKALVLEPKEFKLVGMKIGQEFKGEIVGLPGYMFKITGGSDSAGTPMRFDVHGPVKKRVLLSGGPCYHPKKKHKGTRRRRLVRGNEVTDDMTQVNVIVTKYGKEKFFDGEGTK